MHKIKHRQAKQVAYHSQSCFKQDLFLLYHTMGPVSHNGSLECVFYIRGSTAATFRSHLNRLQLSPNDIGVSRFYAKVRVRRCRSLCPTLRMFYKLYIRAF